MPQSAQCFLKRFCLIFNRLSKKIEEEFDNNGRIHDDADFHRLDLLYRSHMGCRGIRHQPSS
jgi:hypothetical protein